MAAHLGALNRRESYSSITPPEPSKDELLLPSSQAWGVSVEDLKIVVRSLRCFQENLTAKLSQIEQIQKNKEELEKQILGAQKQAEEQYKKSCLPNPAIEKAREDVEEWEGYAMAAHVAAASAEAKTNSAAKELLDSRARYKAAKSGKASRKEATAINKIALELQQTSSRAQTEFDKRWKGISSAEEGLSQARVRLYKLESRPIKGNWKNVELLEAEVHRLECNLRELVQGIEEGERFIVAYIEDFIRDYMGKKPESVQQSARVNLKAMCQNLDEYFQRYNPT